MEKWLYFSVWEGHWNSVSSKSILHNCVIRVRYSRHYKKIWSYTKLIHNVLVTNLLPSTVDANSRLHNTALRVLSLGNYTLFPSTVQFVEAPLEIIFWNALQSSCCCVFHLVCTTEMVSLQLILHDPEEMKLCWLEIWHCHLGICQVAPVPTFWLLTRKISDWWKNSTHCTSNTI
jgi:hypothetical protein